LFPDAESDYTYGMRLGVALFGLYCLATPAMASPGDRSPRELYEALNALRPDPSATYEIASADRIELRRADAKFSFEQGKLTFFAPLDGRITGAVFAGHGHILAAPRDPVEKQQMARFLGTPVLDQDFTNVCLRFTDDTAVELLHQLQDAKISPQQDSEFVARWNVVLAAVNPPQSLRILFGGLSANPQPYFYSAVEGVTTGSFDVVVDLLRPEAVLLGQPKKSGAKGYYDVWASYSLPTAKPRPDSFRALDYEINTSILADTSLDAKTDLRLRAEVSGERVLMFQLARTLNVDAVTGDRGESLTYFQNEGMNLQDRGTRGNNYLYVVLPTPSEKGAEFTLHFHYRGSVIENAGNGVMFVNARESWYPHYGGPADFASYDLTMRWPRKLRLVATGTKREEHEDGEFHVGRWQTEKPVAVAGFNLGDYVSTSLASEAHTVDVYANRQLEQALDNRLGGAQLETPSMLTPLNMEKHGSINAMQVTPPPKPADALKGLARQIDDSIRFYETLGGTFPFQKLSVSQIPGTFGQGWPGLLYLSTYSYLPAEAQQRAGLSESGQEHFTELVPFHEVAHQWWGNVVGWDAYRDQWINEAIANYLALLFADTQKRTDHSLHFWLGRYRQNLIEISPTSEFPRSEIGALELGNRLTSSKTPTGFEEVIYGKGAWVIHMLREMLRQPGAKNPEARFYALLHTLVTKYAYSALSTSDLQHEVEAVMTPSMDLEGGRSMEWFFEQWVRGTGVPRYRVEYSVHNTDKGYLVRGKLYQDDVPRSFIAPVPLYAGANAAHATLLGTVVAAGPETSFHFTTQTEPHKILIDPQMTLLCVTQ
jgi:Peptidase family M1 domain